jgi:hypothetical protein
MRITIQIPNFQNPNADLLEFNLYCNSKSLLLFLFPERYCQPKCCAFVRLALNFNGAAHGFDNIVGDRQTESGAG